MRNIFHLRRFFFGAASSASRSIAFANPSASRSSRVRTWLNSTSSSLLATAGCKFNRMGEGAGRASAGCGSLARVGSGTT